MMYVIVTTGGKQYKVTPGMLLDVELLPGAAGETVRLDQVLAVRSDGGFAVGHPVVEKAVVTAQIVNHLKGKKVISFKYKRRKGYHRKEGHSQNLTRLKVVEISVNGAH